MHQSEDSTNNLIINLINSAEGLISKIETLLFTNDIEPNWNSLAWRWVSQKNKGFLRAIKNPQQVDLKLIQFVDIQKAEIVRNTRQFLNNLPANNVLLTGARGTGKSTLIKGLLAEFASQGLRIIEVDKHDLVDVNEIVSLINNRPEKFIIFCDDLTFEENDSSYKALKVALDGSLEAMSKNVLVYATSNRKNLMPEFMADNLPKSISSDEIRPNDTIEEKTALAERFGLWLSFYGYDQDEYLAICASWLQTYGFIFDQNARQAALSFTHTRGARNGRVAYQFARDYAGKLGLDNLGLANLALQKI